MDYTPYYQDQSGYGGYAADYSALTYARWAICSLLFVNTLLWLGTAVSYDFLQLAAFPVFQGCRLLLCLILLALAGWQISAFPSHCYKIGGYVLIGWAVLQSLGGFLALAFNSIFAATPLAYSGGAVISGITTLTLAFALTTMCQNEGTDRHSAGMILAFAVVGTSIDIVGALCESYAISNWWRYLHIIVLLASTMAWWRFLKRSQPVADGAGDLEASDLLPDFRMVGIVAVIIIAVIALSLAASYILNRTTPIL